jgi:hypothetical protein
LGERVRVRGKEDISDALQSLLAIPLSLFTPTLCPPPSRGRGSIDLPFVPDRFFIKMPALRIKEGFRE